MKIKTIAIIIAIIVVIGGIIASCTSGNSSSSGGSNSGSKSFIGSDGKEHAYVPEFGDDVNNWMAENW